MKERKRTAFKRSLLSSSYFSRKQESGVRESRGCFLFQVFFLPLQTQKQKAKMFIFYAFSAAECSIRLQSEEDPFHTVFRPGNAMSLEITYVHLHIYDQRQSNHIIYSFTLGGRILVAISFRFPVEFLIVSVLSHGHRLYVQLLLSAGGRKQPPTAEYPATQLIRHVEKNRSKKKKKPIESFNLASSFLISVVKGSYYPIYKNSNQICSNKEN